MRAYWRERKKNRGELTDSHTRVNLRIDVAVLKNEPSNTRNEYSGKSREMVGEFRGACKYSEKVGKFRLVSKCGQRRERRQSLFYC